jgi:hypothetical protein
MTENAAAIPQVAPQTEAVRSRADVWLYFAMVGAFGTYFCMYGFRKPFTAATFAGERFWGLDYKTLLVTAQVFGYTVSKFIGIKAVSEILPTRRALAIIVLVAVAQAALLLFAVVPAPWNMVCLFLNGLPLGMVFGLVLGFLEGRRVTELLTAVLCSSFILAGGVTKSVGAWVMELHVPVQWMPFTAGLIFLPPLLFFVWMLNRVPAPDLLDVGQRSARSTMNRVDRAQLFRRHALGLLMIGVMFLLVTVLRSIRDDFAPEIWKGLGLSQDPAIFTRSELIVGLAVPAILGLGIFIRRNSHAFFAAVAIALVGLVGVALTLVALRLSWLSPFAFMVLLGIGLYLPYVAVHTTIFERLVAMTRDRATICYLMYLVDAWGYLGYVAVMLGKSLLKVEGNFLGFFTTVSWVTAIGGSACMIGCWVYFARKSVQAPASTQ